MNERTLSRSCALASHVVGALFLAGAGLAQDVKVPGGWTAETRQVKAATPDGEQTKSIVYYTNSIGMKFVLVPAGEFQMGSPDTEEGRDSNESPQHRVRVTKPFFLSAYEVTQAQYQQVLGDAPARFQGDANPVEKVGYDDALDFCSALCRKEGAAYRLPTEAEWEYACRAGSTTPFHFGSTPSTSQANYDGSAAYGKGAVGQNRQQTLPVGSFPPNAFGLYDMHGNVAEWCQDYYDGDYYKASPAEDPKGPVGPTMGDARIARGGSWFGKAAHARSAARQWAIKSTRYAMGGFRVAVEAPP